MRSYMVQQNMIAIFLFLLRALFYQNCKINSKNFAYQGNFVISVSPKSFY